MAVSERVLAPTQAQQLVNFTPSATRVEDPNSVSIPKFTSDDFELSALFDAHQPALGEMVKDLPSSNKPFAVENIESIKTLKENDTDDDFQNADRRIAALVAIAVGEADIKTEPIAYLQDIESLRYKNGLDHVYRIETRIDQLKTNGEPGSKKAQGPYNRRDKLEVKELAPLIALKALDAFVDQSTLRSEDHHHEFTLSAQDTSQVLQNIFKIVKEKI